MVQTALPSSIRTVILVTMPSAIRSITAKAAWLRYDLGNAQKQLIIA